MDDPKCSCFIGRRMRDRDMPEEEDNLKGTSQDESDGGEEEEAQDGRTPSEFPSGKSRKKGGEKEDGENAPANVVRTMSEDLRD